MTYCTQCGTQISEGDVCTCTDAKQFCTQCGVKLYGQACACTAKPESGEVPVKLYNIAELRNLLRFTRAKGQMQLTSKRVIFSAQGRGAYGYGAVNQEFAIKEIAGIGATNNFRFSVPHFIIGLASVFIVAALVAVITFMGGWAITTMFVSRPPAQEFLRQNIEQVINYAVVLDVSQLSLVLGLFAGFSGITLYFILRKKFWFRLILLGVSLGAFFVVGLTGNYFSYVLFGACVVVCMYGLVKYAHLSDLVITVYSKGGACVDLVRGKGFFASVLGRTGTGYAEIVPTQETYAAIREIGTVIADIQEQSDTGLTTAN
ncbi:MAG: hypothetical protein FWC92_09885 [Defluviitaleaceae bacterium]|nr:hypothetical protein [Defluviitaleaceae bacterium]